MTREEAKELLPIIQAFAEGKKIQYRNHFDEWINIKENEGLSFICHPSDYRIKPQQKYRPFKNQEECWNEMLKHQPFGWVNKNGDYLCLLFINVNLKERDFSRMFKYYTFIDGEPFGIKE